MKRVWNSTCLIAFVFAIALTVVGCEDAATTGEQDEKGSSKSTTSDGGSGSGSAGTVDSGKLSPENTTISFVGRHTDKSKADRNGGFKQFTGVMETSDDNTMPTMIMLDIESESLWTEIDKLTQHLKTPDFFNVREFPKCTFKSTKIEPGEDGMCTITGDLMLLNNTQSITFPAKVSAEGGELKLESEFNIDRTEFGMNYGEDSIEKEVTLTFNIGTTSE